MVIGCSVPRFVLLRASFFFLVHVVCAFVLSFSSALFHHRAFSATPPAKNQVENIEKVLDGVRPFLSVAGGSITIQSLTGVSSIQARHAT